MKTLCREIFSRHAIPAARVLGHSDVAPARKDDPGELFPWEELAAAGIGLWPAEQQTALTAHDLLLFGYDPEAAPEKVILAFQRHFRAARLTGEWDEECGLRLAGLLAKPPFLTL